MNITLRDISCQAEKNATHFMLHTLLSHCGTSLENHGHANNEVSTAGRGADGETLEPPQPHGETTAGEMLMGTPLWPI